MIPFLAGILLALLSSTAAWAECAEGLGSAGVYDRVAPQIALLDLPDTADDSLRFRVADSLSTSLGLVVQALSDTEQIGLLNEARAPGVIAVPTGLAPGSWQIAIEAVDVFGNGAQLLSEQFQIEASGSRVPALAGSFRILGLAPNPFNPRTRLRFELRQAGEVLLRIHSLDGARIHERSLGLLAAGIHEQALAPEGLASGRYLLSLTQGGERRVRSFTLLR